MSSEIESFADALTAAGTRPPNEAKQAEKKNFGERLSRHLATLVANRLRTRFPGVTPDPDGRRQESRARTGKGVKKLDVNYSTTELGLGLGISIKTINFVDRRSRRFTKNYTRVDAELRAEAKDYHQRQPFAVLAAIILLPAASLDDGGDTRPSSYGRAIEVFRWRAGRQNTRNEEELFERVFVGVYWHDGPDEGQVVLMDVQDPPRKKGLPRQSYRLSLDQALDSIAATYDARNNPPFEWDDAE